MANPIDILGLEPTKISRDLRGKYVLLYGLPKTGKTSFAVQAPKNLLIAFEKGYNGLSDIYAVTIEKWIDFKKVLRQLESEAAKEKYYTISIDTATIAWDRCEEYICSREDVDRIGDIPYGGGYDMLKKEFQGALSKITMLGYGLICLAHSEEKPASMGSEEIMVRPQLNKRAYAIINGLVDIIAYISVDFDEKGESVRNLYTRSTPNIFAGSRFSTLPKVIPFGYTELVNALADAIEQEGTSTGRITDERPAMEVESVPFEDVMKEAKEVWMQVVEDDSKTEEAKKIVEDNFGKAFKLSSATERQQDIVENVISALKALLQK